jgi:hypothetical protein
MLTAATLGMAGYGLYSILEGLIDLLWWSRVGIWADLATLAFGLLLLVAAAFVRVLIPGGLALALGALFGLQALSIHAAGSFQVVPQAVRGSLAALVVLLAYLGARRSRADVTAPGPSE